MFRVSYIMKFNVDSCSSFASLTHPYKRRERFYGRKNILLAILVYEVFTYGHKWITVTDQRCWRWSDGSPTRLVMPNMYFQEWCQPGTMWCLWQYIGYVTFEDGNDCWKFKSDECAFLLQRTHEIPGTKVRLRRFLSTTVHSIPASTRQENDESEARWKFNDILSYCRDVCIIRLVYKTEYIIAYSRIKHLLLIRNFHQQNLRSAPIKQTSQSGCVFVI